MHDIDRAMFETGQELAQSETFEAYESENFEQHEMASGEQQQLELAAELLELHSEQELEQFLGDLISRAGSAVKSFATSDTGRAVGGLVKMAARKTLPRVGQVLGDAIVPGVGGQLGSQAGRWLGQQLEMEGLSAEDREFETARAFVRFAQDTARNACRTAVASPNAPAAAIARQAALAAAHRSLPALVPVIQNARPTGVAAATRATPAAVSTPAAGLARSGRWVRSGNGVILLGF